MKFFKKRSNLVITGIVLASIIGGVWYFTQPPANETVAPELQTAKVRTGGKRMGRRYAWDLTPMVTIFRRDGLPPSQGRGH